jgi:hypothetical protein
MTGRRGVRQHPAGGCSQASGMCILPGRLWPGSLQAPHELPQARREQPHFWSASAEELSSEGQAKLRRKLEAVGAGDVALVDARHRPVDDQRAEIPRRRSARMGAEPAERVDEADLLLAGVRRDRSIRRELNPPRLVVQVGPEGGRGVARRLRARLRARAPRPERRSSSRPCRARRR